MANITLISSPPAIALIGEGLNFELQRTTQPASGKASMVINFPNNQALYLDKYFEIQLPDRNLKFYFKTTPDESGLQLFTWNPADDYDDFLFSLVNGLHGNFYLNLNYIVSNNGTGILITAREIGTAYNLDFVGTNITGCTEGTNTAGINNDTPADYRIFVEACLRASTQETSTSLGSDFLAIDSNLKAFANIAEYFKDHLKTSFHFPFSGTLVYEVPDAVINYFIRYAEFSNGAFNKIYNTFYQASKYAIAGGLKQVDADYLLLEQSNYFSMFPERFLTWAPLSKITHIDTPERLYFLTQTTGLKLKAKLYYPSITEIIDIQNISSTAFKVIEILCGVPELFINRDVSDLQAYDVWIEDANNIAVSEVRHFEIDNKQYRNKRTLIFRNSFDKFDMLHCTGDLTITDNITREENIVLTNNSFRKQISLTENSAEYTLASGWLYGEETRLWLEELLLTKNAFLVISNSILPVIIKTTKAEKHTDREYLYQILIAFEPGYNDEFSSNIVSDDVQFYTDETFEIYINHNNVPFIR